jgi:hypothetical protein
MPLQVEYKALSELISKYHPRNPKQHDIGALITSMKTFGYVTPGVLDERTGYFAEGHGRTQALAQMKSQHIAAPERIEVRADDWYVPVITGVSFGSDQELEAFLISANRLTALGGWNEPELISLLQELARDDQALFQATGYDGDDLDALIQQFDEDLQADKPTSDGSLLALAQITIDEPRHTVERGDVWYLGQHVLICADVLSEWQQWIDFLEGDNTLFAPYPGAFVPLSERAEWVKIVMVQPDKYIAAHILDRYSEAKGEANVIKYT